MASQGVQPLRINKNSPSKMSGSATSRPLSEISPMGVRRNSPSFAQSSKRPPINSPDSSPFDASPETKSKLAYWKNRENVSPTRSNENSPVNVRSPLPARRASVENLKKVSRVTNSTMYAREQDSEYDPDASSILSTRPLNSMPWAGALDLRSNPSLRGHKRSESNNKIPLLSPSKQSSPVKAPLSPSKSSLSTNSRFGDQSFSASDEAMASDETIIVSAARADTPRSLRQPKSVTFDEEPPQVKEYEMVTPDPSSVASGSREGSSESDQYDMDESFERERESSFARDDSFDESLEDADKTPVVLPEDWRFMSPDVANTGLAETFEDPFDKRQAARYRSTPERDVYVARSSSVNSNGDHRPLPPLPGFQIQDRLSSSASTGALPRPQPSIVAAPRPASMSKADILGMRASPMPLEERLHLLSIQKEEEEKMAQETKKPSSIDFVEKLIEKSKQLTPDAEYRPPPRVSRESILRKVRTEDFDDEDCETSSPVAARSEMHDEIDYANLDPDVAIPSREASSTYDDQVPDKAIKREEDVEQTIDMYAAPEGDDNRPVSPYDDDFLRESSVVRNGLTEEDVSDLSSEAFTTGTYNEEEDDGQKTPRAEEQHELGPSIAPEAAAVSKPFSNEMTRMSLPEFSSFYDKDDDFGFGLGSYLTPSPPHDELKKGVTPASEVIQHKPVLRPSTPVEQLQPPPTFLDNSFEDHFGTPEESILHYSPPEDPLPDQSAVEESVRVPEPEATIKAAGSKLKTRVSATPADLKQMAAARRHVSGEQPPPVEEDEDEHEEKRESLQLQEHDASAPILQAESFDRRRSVRKLDLPLGESSNELGIGLTEEFDRLMEAKKKGYLMRQNTKVVVANSRQPSGESKASNASNDEPASATGADGRPESRGTRSAGSSPRKSSAQTWTTEPWNGKMRRQSTRRTNIVPEKPMSMGPMPPLPGHESNVLDGVAEDSFLDDPDEAGERGRVFVKVVGVKDLDLPLPKNERCHFQMTLDNGLHCVTTSWSELGRTAPIGQEFELVVFDDLEFQLLLQTRLERPRSSASSVQSSVGSLSTKKTSAFSRMFTSPKKRREQEKKQQEEEARLVAQRQAEAEAHRASKQPTAWDLQNELVGADGSFARAYISLSNHEQQCYGRPFTVDIPAWNEWAMEDKAGASTRSKMGGVQRKPPYRIGNIELQLMYIPRPKGVADDDMPRSMSAAVRHLKDAEATVTRAHEGHLSQQGGDCPYWRRRFFKLNGSKLTAYHDMTRQPRATISLAKASKLIDDKSSLTKTDQSSPSKAKGRRKSAFAEDEEGYMFVEEGFRMRFHNGEVIDFYADSREHKDEWMKVLSEAVGRESPTEKKTWMSVVLAKERAANVARHSKLHQVKEEQVPARDTSKTGPAILHKNDVFSRLSASAGTRENRPPPIEKDPQSPTKARTSLSSPVKAQTGMRSPVKRDSLTSKRSSGVTPASTSSSPRKQDKGIAGKRQQVRSMIF